MITAPIWRTMEVSNMGLDMWLARRRKLPSVSELVASQYLVEEVIHWRKADAIHHFFDERTAEGIANCAEYVFFNDDIRNLLNLVTEVLEHPERTNEHPPNLAGFSFRSTEYDKWDVDDLKHTHEALTKALANAEPHDEFVYSAWW